MDSMKLEETFIERFVKSDTYTTGRFWFMGEVVYILELPWLDNQKEISCIPKGSYIVEKTYSPKYKKKMWEVLNVPNRSGIRIHTANYTSQIQGCLVPGLSLEDIDGDGIMDIKSSRKAMTLMNDTLPDKFKLDIIWNNTLTF